MAFDPDAFLAGGPAPAPAPKKKPPGFDPDAFLAGSPPQAAPAGPTVSQGEAALRGGVGGFIPFLDEVTGAVKGFAENRDIRNIGNDYRRNRDQERSRNQAAAEQHPGTYYGAQATGALASAFVPGLNAVKGASLGVKLGRAAATGAGYALGASDADITRGDFGGAARDMLMGAGTSAVGTGVAHGIGKGLSAIGKAAQNRVAGRTASDLLEKVPATTQDRALAKFGGDKINLAEYIEADAGLAKAAKKGADALHGAAKGATNQTGKEIGKIVSTTDEMVAGVPKTKVREALLKLRSEYVQALDEPRVAAVERELKSLDRLTKGQETIKAAQVHKLAQRYGKSGFKGGSFENPSEAKVFAREMNAAMREVLQEHVDDVAKANGTLETSASRLRALNEQYGKQAAVRDLAKSKALRDSRNAPGLGDRVRQGIQLGSDVAAVGAAADAAMTGDTSKLGLMALPLAARGLPMVVRSADKGIAAMYRALSSGGSVDDALRLASQYGVPRELAGRMVEIWGPRTTQDE